MDWALVLAAVAAAFFAASVGVIALWFFPERVLTQSKSIFLASPPSPIFLFDGETLIDSTASARALLSVSPIEGSPWKKLMGFLASRFENPDVMLQNLASNGIGEVITSTRGKQLILRAENDGGLTKITLIDETQDDHANTTDPLAQRSMLDELALQREIIAAAPTLIWRENANGDVIWANGPYLLLAFALPNAGSELSWPLPHLFDKAAVNGMKGQRHSIAEIGPEPKWFDVTVKTETGGVMVFATPADAAVKAETALRDFMQTLTKTFAQLPIGLAIFDHKRRLQLFNPALMDLTALQPDFLSSRPTMLAVLDAMRDRKMLPEPKNYRDWRRQIVQMEKAAAQGQFEETWNLPDGQTYKVVGRPHPNGALALLIEDISNEMSRTRSLKADLELGQSVIDELEDAIVVFSQSGDLVMSNAAYTSLWLQDPGTMEGQKTARGLSAHWRSLSAPNALWTEVDEYVATIGDREKWTGEARLLDGRLLSCRCKPLASGATMVTFRLVTAQESSLQVPLETAQLLSA